MKCRTQFIGLYVEVYLTSLLFDKFSLHLSVFSLFATTPLKFELPSKSPIEQTKKLHTSRFNKNCNNFLNLFKKIYFLIYFKKNASHRNITWTHFPYNDAPSSFNVLVQDIDPILDREEKEIGFFTM